jgi:nucleotide-binding universal stress UspA family protein
LIFINSVEGNGSKHSPIIREFTMIKDIVVNLPLGNEDTVTPFAASMAGYFNAHLTGIAFIYQPIITGVEIGAAASTSYIDEQMAESQKAARAAAERFKHAIQGEEISAASRTIETIADDASRKFADIARAFDVAIVGQVDPHKAVGLDDLMIEAALFESGRPTIVVPYIDTGAFKLDRVTICWDRSRVSTRAIADALPVLSRAGSIDLLSVYGENTHRDELDGIDMAEHLARHGFNVDIKSVPMANDVASSILNFTAENDTDLLVMGGYGHSRLREFILGGATKGILNSMTVPTFMSH